jgi:hypothetical protein
MLSKGDEGSWSIMLDRFLSEENAQEKNKLLYGLGKDASTVPGPMITIFSKKQCYDQIFA